MTSSSRPMTRTVAAVLSMFLPLGVVVGSFALWRDQLPPELASHWSGTGPADGVMTVAQFLTLALSMTGAAALGSLIVTLWPGLGAQTRRNVALILGVVAGAGASSWLGSAVLTMQAGDPYQAVQGPWSLLALAAAGYGVIPYLLLPKPPLVVQDVAERIDVAPGSDIAWSRTVTAPLFLWGVLVLGVVGIGLYGASVVTGTGADGLLGVIVIVLVMGVLAAFSRFRVTADWRGLRVVSSLLRIPLKRIRLTDISTVEADELRPTEWGGWGYRIMPGRSALILRKGPGLIVTTTTGKQFALTLDDPDTPAALLATLRDARLVG